MSKINLDFHKTIELKNGKIVTLRYVRPGDIDTVLDFVNLIADENEFTNLIYRKTYEEELDWLINTVKNILLGKEIFIGVFAGERYIGSVGVSTEEIRGPHVGVFGIVLAPEFRGLGLGRIMLQEALQQAKDHLKMTMVRLSCFANNDVAIQLYLNEGFVEYGRLPGGLKYRDMLVDQILMYKKL